jgi:hypothetical protein
VGGRDDHRRGIGAYRIDGQGRRAATSSLAALIVVESAILALGIGVVGITTAAV